MRLLILRLVAILTGGAPLVWGLSMTSRIRESATWPTVDGKVVSSRVVADSSRIRGGGYTRYHRVDVRYEFTVAGQRYESNTFVFGVPRSYPDLPSAQTEVSLYPVGGTVTVRYDPDDPATATLAPGEVPSVYSLLLGTAGLIAFIGLVMLTLGIRSLRKRRG